MKKVFYLKTCSTCLKIIKQLNLSDFNMRELKANNLTEIELDYLYQITNSYESLFSKKSSQIKFLGLDVKSFSEEDYKKYILQHYSFLKRPIVLSNDNIYIGNSKENVTELIKNFGVKLDNI